MPRTATSARVSASNRRMTRDMRASFKFNGTSDSITLPFLPSVTGFNFAVWVKAARYTLDDRLIDYQDSGPSGGFTLVATASSKVSFTIRNGAGSVAALTSDQLQPGIWYHFVGTYIVDSAILYVNAVAGTPDTSVTMSAPTQTLRLGRRSAASTNFFAGNMAEFVFQNTTTPWTQAQINDLYYRGVIPTGATCILNLNEGAGLVANDTSGNGNNGTITSGTFVKDTPIKMRQATTPNLVYNGDFEYAPPFTAATSTSARWIDGTSGGSTTNNVFGWATSIISGTANARYTPNALSNSGSIIASTTATGSRVDVGNVNALSGANVPLFAIPVTPNTFYTMSFDMSTVYTSGDSSDGAFLDMSEYTLGGTFVFSNVTTKVKTTTSKTNYFGIFLTGATTRFILPRLRVVGNTGAATLIMSATADNISLSLTIPTERVAVS